MSSNNLLSQLGVQLGLFNAGAPETEKLMKDYFSFISMAKAEQASGTGESHCWAKVNRHMACLMFLPGYWKKCLFKWFVFCASVVLYYIIIILL